MEVSFLHHCTAPPPPSHRPLLRFSKKFSASCSFKPKFPKFPTHFRMTINSSPKISAKPVPARDQIIEFGRHKGKMLGSLPSSYLKWVSETFRYKDDDAWAKLADEVLSDPIYGDRVEWEFAYRIMSGDGVVSHSRGSVDGASELVEISKRFGWDFEDNVGWGKVNFELLGTSKGGRIPRISEKGSPESAVAREKVNNKASSSSDGVEARGGGGRRRERRERSRMKRDGGLELRLGNTEDSRSDGDVVDDDDGDKVMPGGNPDRSRFPGRDSLFKKVLDSRKRQSF